MAGLLKDQIAAARDNNMDPAELLALEQQDYKAALAYKLDTQRVDVDKQKADNENTDSARKAYVSIQESVHSSKLAKNIQPVLAIIVLLTSVMSPLMVMASIHLDDLSKQTMASTIGNLNNLALLVLGFYFGSAHRDKEHDKALLNALPGTKL